MIEIKELCAVTLRMEGREKKSRNERGAEVEENRMLTLVGL